MTTKDTTKDLTTVSASDFATPLVIDGLFAVGTVMVISGLTDDDENDYGHVRWLIDYVYDIDGEVWYCARDQYNEKVAWSWSQSKLVNLCHEGRVEIIKSPTFTAREVAEDLVDQIGAASGSSQWLNVEIAQGRVEYIARNYGHLENVKQLRELLASDVMSEVGYRACVNVMKEVEYRACVERCERIAEALVRHLDVMTTQIPTLEQFAHWHQPHGLFREGTEFCYNDTTWRVLVIGQDSNCPDFVTRALREDRTLRARNSKTEKIRNAIWLRDQVADGTLEITYEPEATAETLLREILRLLEHENVHMMAARIAAYVKALAEYPRGEEVSSCSCGLRVCVCC